MKEVSITVIGMVSSYKSELEHIFWYNLRVYTEISLGLYVNGFRHNNIFWWGYNNLL